MLATLLAVLAVNAGPLGALPVPFVAIGMAGLWLRQWRERRQPSERRTRLRALIAGFALEELLVGGALAGVLSLTDETYWRYLQLPGALPVFLIGAGISVYLWRGWPLPHRLLPLRGRWLRHLLTAVALFALLYGGPWMLYLLGAYLLVGILLGYPVPWLAILTVVLQSATILLYLGVLWRRLVWGSEPVAGC